MNLNWKKVGSILCSLTVAAMASAQDVPYQVVGGSAVVSFNMSTIQNANLEITGLVPTEFGNYPQEGGIGFTIERISNMQVMPEDRAIGHHLGGNVRVKGGFTLKSGNAYLPFYNAKINAAGADPDSDLALRDGSEGSSLVYLSSEQPAAYLNVFNRTLTLGWSTLKISREGALALKRPELEDLVIGQYSIFARVEPQKETNPPPFGGPTDGNVLDVSLHRMSSLTSMGRTGTYPNGVSGFAMSTTSCNPGDVNIWWYSPMDQRHPVIVQNMFRIRNGRLEQIGAAYLKHGFFATNTTDGTCGPGQHPGTGSLLGPGLTDTYGSGNNGDRYYLGPRSEVNPLTGEWTAFGSFFDVGTAGSVPDGARSLTSTQANALPAHKNRIEVQDGDLINQPGGTRFFYESIYINPRQRATVNDPWLYDVNMYNQVGIKEVTPTWNAGTTRFVFSELNSGVNKIDKLMIQQYGILTGNPAVMATPNTEGDVWVAVNPINEGGGVYRYEIAVFNFTSDRQISEFSFPILDGLTVTDVGFRDSDLIGTNQWTSSYANCLIKWTMPASPNQNPLTYGSVYNFYFKANIAPQTNKTTLKLFKAPTGGSTLTQLSSTNLLPPDPNISATAMGADFGNIAGSLSDLTASDNAVVTLTETNTLDEEWQAGLRVDGTSPILSPSKLEFFIETRGDLDGRYQVVQFWNVTTNSYDTVNISVVGPTDVSKTITVNGAANTNKYINQTTKAIRARVLLSDGSQDTVEATVLKVDVAKWKVTF